MKRLFYIVVVCGMLFAACERQNGHTAPAILEKDSVAMMTTNGVNTMISDSGVMKYRIVSEEWKVNQSVNPPRWIFEKGIFLEQFDDKFKVQTHIKADTAYYFTDSRLWELRGRVAVATEDGLKFNSEQLFWDSKNHKLYSNVFSRLVTPDRSLQGGYFWSDERMTKYYVSDSKGSFEKGMLENNDEANAAAQDSMPEMMRPQAQPVRKSTSSNRK